MTLTATGNFEFMDLHMRLGIFGGSFDPVHYGHLLLADSCREQCNLDRVLLIPAAVAPHKRNDAVADAKHRVAMLELAIAGDEGLHVDTTEIDRGGVSYTVDTLAAVAEKHSEDELFLLVGADTLNDLPSWREPRRVCELALPVAVTRAGSPPPDYQALAGVATAERVAAMRDCHVEMPLIELSSTDLRNRVASGKSLRYRTPRAVEKYIETHEIYRGDEQVVFDARGADIG